MTAALGASAAFDLAVAFVLQDAIEGGYVDHPMDRGGATNRGITLGTLRAQGAAGDLDGDGDVDKDDVRRISVEAARDIYYRHCWIPAHCDELALRSAKVALVHFDAVVQHGPGGRGKVGAANLLQRAVRTIEDAWIGPKTLQALDRRLADLGEAQFLEVLLEHRLGHYARILKLRPEQAVFRNGWRARFNALCRHVGVRPLWPDFSPPTP